MVKSTSQRYQVGNRRMSLKELYFAATPVEGKNKGILRFIHTEMAPGIPIIMVFVRHQHRQNTDQRTLGGLFSALCDEVSELDWAIALQQLLEIFNDVTKMTCRKIIKFIKSQLQQWIAGLPSYIKIYLPDLYCES